MAKTTLRAHRKSIDYMLLAMAAASTGKTVVAAKNIEKALKCRDFQIAMGELDTLNEEAFDEGQAPVDDLMLEPEDDMGEDSLDVELSKLLASADDEEEVEDEEEDDESDSDSDDEDSDAADEEEEDDEEEEAATKVSASVRRMRNLKAVKQGSSATKRLAGRR